MPQEIAIARQFTLNRTTSSQHYKPGVYEFSNEDLEQHGDYIRAFSIDAPAVAPAPGDHNFAQLQREPLLRAIEAQEEGARRLAEFQQKQNQERFQRAAEAQQVYADAQRSAFERVKPDPKAMAEALAQREAVQGPVQSPLPDHPAIHDAYLGVMTPAEAAVGGPNTGAGFASSADNYDPKSPEGMRTSDDPKAAPPPRSQPQAEARQVGSERNPTAQDKRNASQ